MKKIIYYILNYIFFYSLELKIMNILEDEKKLVIFDVGCFRGTFSRKILHLIKKRKFKFYLFDVNKNTKRYILDLIKSL
jgi:G:T-mismatch repair DNA endonuclease (very short patch repair protein)